VLLQVALGALHIDVLVGRKLRADLIICSETGLDVFSTTIFKCLFQILTDRTIHGYPSSPPAAPTVAVDGVPLPPRFQDLLLGVDPVLFVLAGFTTTAFIQLIGPFSNPVLCWDGATLLGELFGPTILGCGCV
jgi:hypothetical protein